jgi:hypothetical protein
MRRAVGLLGFAAYALATDDGRKRATAALVVAFGLAYHAAHAARSDYEDACLLCDILCVAVLSAAINAASTAQPRTALGTIAALVLWPLGWGETPLGDAVHVLGVQGVLLACLATAW